MSAQSFPIETADGVDIVPTSGTFYTPDMPIGYTSCHVYVEFFADQQGKVPASASAGTIAIAGSPQGNIYLEPKNNGTINAVDVSAGEYSPSVMVGAMVKGRVVFNSIAGAAFARIIFWRF